jgi:amidohydrolase
MIDFIKESQQLFSYTQTMRRDFHAHPELGFREIRTSGIISKELQKPVWLRCWKVKNLAP